MFFIESQKKTDSNNIQIDRTNKPSFKLGQSVFREVISPLESWKRFIPFQLRKRAPRNLIIHLNGANACLELKEGAGGKSIETHEHHLWSPKEKAKFINKLTAKSKAEQQIISTGRFYAILIFLGLIVILQIIGLRGARIF